MAWIGVKKNRERLRELMAHHDLTKKQVSTMLNRSSSTIETYCSRSGVDIPDHLLELLELKLLQQQ